MSEKVKSAARDKEKRGEMLGLAFRMTLYYAVLALLIVILLRAFPVLADVIPVGGIDDVAASDPALQEINAKLLRGEAVTAADLQSPETTPVGQFDEALRLLLAMTGTILLMLPVAWLFQCIHGTGEQDHSLDETALILPTVVAGIVTIVQHSLALAFSLAGIVAGVRFRRTLSDTFDTLFIFVAIGVGIAAGVGAIEIAGVMTVFFNYATLGVCLFGDGLETQHVAERRKRRRKRKEERKAQIE